VGAAARSVVVVGASAAGLRCACRLARLQPSWDVLVVEEREVFSYGACGLPYVLSGDIGEAEEVRRTAWGVVRDAEFFDACKGVRVLPATRAVEVRDGVLAVEGPSGREELPWDELVLATGARARRLPGQPDHPAVRTFHTWDDVEPLREGLIRGRIGSVAVVGAGPIGCELAEAFVAMWGAEVTLLEAMAHPLPGLLGPEAAAVATGVLKSEGVAVRCGAPVEAIEPAGEGVVVTAGGERHAVDTVVVAVGVEPAVELARTAGAALGPTGAIAVDERLATSVPHVWAAGDCIECRHAVTDGPVHLPLGSLANRQGRILANVLAGRDDRFGPVAGSVAVKVFDLEVAAVGCSLERSLAHGLDAAAVWMTTDAAAHYWPESSNLHLCLVYERGTGRVLGLQAVGRRGAVRAVDVAAQLVARGGTLGELEHLEHAYAPPFAPALDPVAVAASVALNACEGVTCTGPLEPPPGRVLDVRLPEEIGERRTPFREVLELPLHELRRAEVPGGPGELLVVCERGTRSAEAVRLLAARGVTARYLGGGLLWRWAAGNGQGGAS